MKAVQTVPATELVFPDSDGQPMAENTRQYEAIVTLKGNIEAFAPATAFVAGDHLIYVDPTDPSQRQAPDVYVAFGRPRGHRGSYKVWEEDNIFPQVIFEVLGPSNTPAEMRAKRHFYFQHGAEEYYEFDPEAGTWLGFIRNPDTGQPEPVETMDGFVSPRLGMKFDFAPLELRVYRPDGRRFLSFQELHDLAERNAHQAAEAQRLAERNAQQAAEAQQRAAEALQQAEEARRRLEQAAQQAEYQRQESERLRALLRAAGIDPDTLPPS
ncbi:MAG: Uma2 family endonuclease [Gemmataceae bacterium]|nr:Uma2 family endonuclease [Gemmata sp.]MDW8198790.1 Uma2 family endonuclease [Gemmataceae bacterium]